MPLPSDYDTPEGEALAEVVIRQALVDCFLASGATDYGFSANLAHPRPRYPKTNEEWLAIGTIEDPDTAETPGSTPSTVARFFSVKHRGFRRSLQQLNLRYEIALSFGFKDKYEATALTGENSHDQQVACAMRYQKYLADNLNLGLDDRITHGYLEMVDNMFIPKSKQGDAALALIGNITVFLTVC